MFKYISKRVLIFIPTFIIISLIAFSLSKLAPGDPVELITKGGGGAQNSGQLSDKMAGELAYQQTAERLGLNLPTFYFGLKTKSTPDTLYKIIKQEERTTLEQLIGQYGNWQQISGYYLSLKQLETSVLAMPNDSSLLPQKRKVRNKIRDLYISSQAGKINNQLKLIAADINADSTLQATVGTQLKTLENNYKQMVDGATPAQNYVPSVAWYGTKNQYHRWISGFLKGDFGISYLDNRPVASKIWDALRWTLTINLISLLVSYILAIFLGVWSAVRKGTKADQIVTTALFVLYSLPSFWIGTMLIVFFTSPEYGMNLFPPGQVTSLPLDAPFGQRFVDIAYHLTLPIICISYGSLAFISRQMRGGMLSILQQDYIRTARAKGLSEKQVIWRHAFRNSLFPIITLFASIFPATIAGSIVIEVIYSIPGMGMLSLGAINARDWPVVFTVLLLAAILTMLGNLVADLLYAFVDPRVSFDKK